ncbi:MAG: WYL domain-containing protein [Clostridia bacterium]|nr:WYL domain-containing protein [Clostridia bacterium]
MVLSKIKGSSLQRSRFARIYYIDQQLRHQRYPNVPKLAREWEVHRRTIERDIEFMRDRLGAPIAFNRHRMGYYYTEKDFQLPSINLTEGELVTLFLGQKLLNQCAGTVLEDSVRSAFEKIYLFLPQSVSVDFDTLEQAISFDVEPLRDPEQLVAQVYQQLATAIHNRKTVRIKYHTMWRDVTEFRNIDPYHLRYFRGAWYLIGYCHMRQDIRIFALDRIKELNETANIFTPIQDFSLPEYLQSSLGIEMGENLEEVVIKFDRHQARWIRERCWHPSQVLEPQQDGSLILRLTVSGLGEVKRWVMSFGSHAEVLAPASLREETKQEIEAMRRVYQSDPL